MIRALFLEEMSLWSWVWQSTLFVLVGLIGSFLLRHRPARACQVLFLAMLMAVVVPVMSVCVTHFGWGLLASEPVPDEPEIANEIVAVDYQAPSVTLSTDFQVNAESAEIQDEVLSEVSQATIVPIEPGPVKVASRSVIIPWRLVFVFGWMIAAVILLGRLFIGFVGGICLLQRTKLKHDAQIQRASDSARARLGITKGLRIRSGGDVRSPMIWCWSRPPILLVPTDVSREVDWVDVICHELAHWRRWDHLIGLIAELAVCILPWNPLLWWARRRIVTLSEQACDDWVLAGGRVGTDYAQSLLNLSPKGQMAFLPTMIGKEKPMKERIYRIVKEKYGDPRIGVRWILVMTIIAATLTVGVAFAQRRPMREGREPRESSEQRAKLENQMRDLEARMDKVKGELRRLDESGKGESEGVQRLRDELGKMSDKMARTERELRGFEGARREREPGQPREGREQRNEILRRLEELGRQTELALRKLEEQQPDRRDEAVDLQRRMWELNEQMRRAQREFRQRLEEPDRRRPEPEGRERPEIDRRQRVEELLRRIEELRINARDKERALHELEEGGKGETEDARVVRGKIEEIRGRMRAVEEEFGEAERERARMREGRGRFESGPSPEAMMREREELGEKARQLELELRELGDGHPERAQMLEKQLQEIHGRIEQIEHEPDRFERPQPHAEELHVRREHLRARLGEIERVLAELNEQGKGEGEDARNLSQEMREIQEQLEATERELQGIGREGHREPGRGDLEREVQELRMQMNNVNAQMGELREMLTRLLEERGPREPR